MCLLTAMMLAILYGCGGSGTESETAQEDRVGSGLLDISIDWPERSRLIPDASESVKLQALSNGSVVAEQVLPRPAEGETKSSATIRNLGAGDLKILATAHPKADGSGTAQATAETMVTIESGITKSVSLAMASTIARITSQPPSVTVVQGTSKSLTATALTNSGQVVLVSHAKCRWTSSDPTIAEVTGTGLAATITGKKAGSTIVTLLEQESGIACQVPVGVAGGGDVTITPASHAMKPGTQATFTASAASGSQAFTWDITQGSGSIVNPNLNPITYVAGNQEGTVILRATQTSTGKSGTATITISSGTETLVVVNPSEASIRKRESFQFESKVTGLADQTVTWRLNPTTGATIGPDGKFQSTDQEGQWQIFARAKDGTECAVPARIYVTAPAHDLTIDSKPGQNVAISVSRADVQGEKDGTTWFKRIFKYLEPVTLSAANKLANRSVFDRWIVEDETGKKESTNAATAISMAGNTVATAKYFPACEVSVNFRDTSGQIITGLSVTTNKPDLDVKSSITDWGSFYYTLFDTNQQTVRITASGSVGNRVFSKWQLDGVDAGTNTNIDLKVDKASKFLTAVYATRITFTVESAGVSGVPIPFETPRGSFQKSTTFAHQDDAGQWKFTAPQNHGGKSFVKWTLPGGSSWTSRTLPINVDVDYSLKVVYQ